jgi:hypothetical protein
MNELSVVDKGADWRRLKAWSWIQSPPRLRSGFTTWDFVEFFAWYGQEP